MTPEASDESSLKAVNTAVLTLEAEGDPRPQPQAVGNRGK